MEKKVLLSSIASIFTLGYANMFEKGQIANIQRPINFKQFNLIQFLMDVREYAPLKGYYIRPNHQMKKKIYNKHCRRFERNAIFKNLTFKTGV